MDLNGDGNTDLLSGSWPGELFFFAGDGDGEYSAPVMLQNKDGDYINIGGGIREDEDGSILITGHATFDITEEGNFVDYHGERMESTAEKPIMVTGTASVVHAADWDNDGDHDLIVGDIRGGVYLVPNEGSSTDMQFGEHIALEAGEEKIKVPGGDAGPVVVDWDADEDLDLVVGCGDGSVVLYRNSGSRDKPVLESAEQLVSPGEVSYGEDAPLEPVRGKRAKVCVTDFNADGQLDLLVGDYGTLGHEPKELTDAEQEKHEQLEQELDELNGEYRELIDKLMGSERVTDEDELDAVQQQMKELRERMGEIRSELPEEYSVHGWVWLFEAIPDDADGS